MATYRVTDPSSGRTIKLTGDSPPTESELNDIFKSVPVAPIPTEPSLLQKGYEALAIPEQKSKEGLQMIAKAVSPQQEVTGNLTRDVAMNLPRIGAETLSEVAPGFISRGAILTAGALRGAKAAAPLLKIAGRAIARGAESISGLEYKTPGILAEAAANPKLLFSPGKESVVYEAAKEAGGKVRESLSQIPEKIKMVKESLKLADKGTLNATEALEARKELYSIKKTVSKEYFRKATEKLNEVAKPVFGKADEAYKQGVKADALRMLLPVNKGGGTSIAKSALGTFAGVGPMAAMSPLVQGGIATGVGAAAKAASPLINNPVISAEALQLAQQAKNQFQLKPDVEALKQGRKVEVKPLPTGKPLSESTIKTYLKKAKNNKEKARALAIKDGYDPELPIAND